MKQILAYSPLLRSGIQSFITAKQASVSPEIPWGADFLERLLPFATAGKLLRGSVTCFSYQAFSGQAPSEAVLKTAMALELAHSGLLIHDDIMDEDDTRRGRPALHRQYQSIDKRPDRSDSSHFGVSMAICGGDAALFMAFELLAGSQTDPKISRVLKELFSSRFAMVCAGQMQDIYFEAMPSMPTKKAIYDLMRVKTASYTMALPLEMGAVLAGQPPAILKTLRAIGEAAGIIFQIRDDELGIMGSVRKLGKPIGSDIKEGKKTLLYYYLLKFCGTQDRALLKASFGNPAATPRQIQHVQKLVRHYRIPEVLNQDIAKLQAKAFQQIEKLNIPSRSKTELKALVEFCASRQA